jgi:phosphatidate cytidylyltransferase
MNETLTRLLSGVVYICILLFATYNSANSFFILFGIFMLIAVYEFCKLVKINLILPLLIASASYFSMVYFKSNREIETILLSICILVSIKLLVLLFNIEKFTLSNFSKYIYLLGYVILPFILITKIPFGIKGYNPKIILSIFFLIWTNDTFAYIVGKSIGKNKLFEKISPKKTIEGFIGGLVFTAIAGYLISKFYFKPNPNHAEMSIFIWIVTAVIVTIFSTLGDLIESKFKRIAGVKDSGKIMPGHGGILDRLDSIIFVSPFVFLFYQILYYVS